MDNWLTKISQATSTDQEKLLDSLGGASASDLNSLLWVMDPSTRPTQVESLQEKLAHAAIQGRELAHEDPTLQKIAFVPALLAGAGRALAGGGAKSIIGGAAKDLAIGTAGGKIMGALKPAAPAAAAAGEIAGGFKYAFAGGQLLQRAAGYTVRNPGTALTAAGAIGGAMMAPRDPQTGQKQYLRGAVIGGVGAAGINAVSNGAIANKMRSSVMNRQNPILGQGTRQYLMDSAAAGQGKSPLASSLRSKQVQYGKAPVAPPAPAATTPSPGVATAPVMGPTYQGGPVTGQVKVATLVNYIEKLAQGIGHEKRANQQLLTYDPATKTFTKQDTKNSGPPGMGKMSSDDAASYGSREYFQSRLQEAGVSTNRFNSGVKPSSKLVPAQDRGRMANWSPNEGMGLGTPAINRKAALLPGISNRPRILPTMAGLSIMRK